MFYEDICIGQSLDLGQAEFSRQAILGCRDDLRNGGFSRGRESDSTLILGDRRWIATGFETISGSGLRRLCPAAGRASGAREPTIDGF
jgi:hypothetical protein